MTSPAECDLLRNAFEEAFRDAIEAKGLSPVLLQYRHGSWITIQAFRDRKGISLHWVGARDTYLECRIFLPSPNPFRRRAGFHLFDVGRVLGIAKPAFDPPWNFDDAVRQLLQTGWLYAPIVGKAFDADPELIRAVRDVGHGHR